MMLPVRLRFGLLVLGLGLCVAAAAEEHKAAEHGTASKSATTASKSATSSTKPAVAFATFEHAQAKELALDKKPAKEPAQDKAQAKERASASAPEPVRNRPVSASVPRRNPVTMAALSAQAAAEPTRPMDAAKAIESPAPAVQHKPHSLHWSYEGETGPHAWAKLAPEFAKCGSGQRQSPIDIREGMKLELEPITFEYRPSSFKVVDNGHTIQASVNGWNSMRLMGRVFRLVQFHFHRPSEEMIDGKQFEMVVHLVHKDSQERLAVVAVLVEVGARQPVIQTVLNNLPLEKGEEIAVTSTSLDISQMLPQSRRYFTYMGSLTTPPCSEDVLWVVMKQPVQATADQLDLFSRMYPMNARPVQASMGRTIKESN